MQPDNFNTLHLFEFTTQLILTRPLKQVSPDYRSSEHVWKSSTTFLPDYPNPKSSEREPGAHKLRASLQLFAEMLEEALDMDEEYVFKTVVGPNRFKTNTTENDQSVWLVRLSKKAERGIHYTILNQGNPCSLFP